VLALYQKAIDLDPVSSNCYEAIGWYYVATRKLPEADAAFRKALDLLPMNSSLHNGLGVVMSLRGDAPAALSEFHRDAAEYDQQWGVAMAYFALGRKADADAALSKLKQTYATRSASTIALVLAYRGENDQAFAWLDRAFQQLEGNFTAINRKPFMESLHGDPRWKAFLRKMKLPE
jgi:adenylate cyclase